MSVHFSCKRNDLDVNYVPVANRISGRYFYATRSTDFLDSVSLGVIFFF